MLEDNGTLFFETMYTHTCKEIVHKQKYEIAENLTKNLWFGIHSSYSMLLLHRQLHFLRGDSEKRTT